jgi:purine-binding chemotaxis protein CheW
MSDANNHGHKGREVISFLIGTQEFCVDITSVREIRGWGPETPLPHAPAYVRGMINLRGIVLPVIDMAARLGIPTEESAPRRVIVIVWIGGRLVGLLVDGVCDILTVPEEAMQATPDLSPEKIKAFISAVVTMENRMICLIALEHLLPELDVAAA